MKRGTGRYERLLERCRALEPVPTAVAHPCEKTALAGAIEAGQHGLIAPLLVGPAQKIEQIAKAERIDLGNAEIIDTPHSHASAARAVELVRERMLRTAAALEQVNIQYAVIGGNAVATWVSSPQVAPPSLERT